MLRAPPGEGKNAVGLMKRPGMPEREGIFKMNGRRSYCIKPLQYAPVVRMGVLGLPKRLEGGDVKNLYINSRLHPLLVDVGDDCPGEWLFTGGEPWLLLTPDRLGLLGDRLGRGDWRVHRLLGLIRRHVARPELFCRRLGVAETRYIRPEDYPPVLCPRCDGLHQPHPEDAGSLCPDCRERERQAQVRKRGGGELRDRLLDRDARKTLLEKDPSAFDGDTLSPNYKFNQRRRLERDWDAAVNRILMGLPYRQVSREFDCSVGLLHRKVKERYWERN